jgi:hypothetical protein
MIGLATGCESMVVPVLLSELAHPTNRGKITSIHQVRCAAVLRTDGRINCAHS